MFVYVNGEVVPEAKAQISIMDHGFMYGLGIFETFRIYEGHPFLLDDHFRRLGRSLMEIGVEWTMSKQEVVSILNRLLEANKLRNAYIRWNVSAGPGVLGLPTNSYESPTTIVYIKELPQALPNAKKARILQTRRNTPEGLVRLKSHHYLNNILGKRELGQATDYEGIFLTDNGVLAEGVVSNLFWLSEGKVYTPAEGTGILNGITRQLVIALLNKLSIPTEIGYYKPDVLKKAEEIFITNSIQEIVSITELDGYFSINHVGKLTEALQNAYRGFCYDAWSIEEILKRT